MPPFDRKKLARAAAAQQADRDMRMPFVPERLVVAREMRGIELLMLEYRTGLPIERFERGLRSPSHDDLRVLSARLGFPPAWFTKPIETTFPPVEQTSLCSRNGSGSCDYCSKSSASLCDYPVNGGTCDAPLCRDHRLHVRGRDIDYCPGHADCTQISEPQQLGLLR